MENIREMEKINVEFVIDGPIDEAKKRLKDFLDEKFMYHHYGESYQFTETDERIETLEEATKMLLDIELKRKE